LHAWITHRLDPPVVVGGTNKTEAALGVTADVSGGGGRGVVSAVVMWGGMMAALIGHDLPVGVAGYRCTKAVPTPICIIMPSRHVEGPVKLRGQVERKGWVAAVRSVSDYRRY